MKLSGATALCACAGGVGISGCSKSTDVSNVPPAPEGSYRRDGDRVIVSLTAANQLNPVGGAARFTLDGGEDAGVKIVVVHSEDETYQAFADRCTHRGKTLDYLHEGKRLQCRSGKAQFDLEGNVIKGPAESALLVYPTRREGDQLVIEVAV
jgi:nitrite reductase/ring-hydroxylating ferredoxin subunit